MAYEKPVFVVSAPRSGSTLLRLILDAHPALAVPAPAWLYELVQPYLYSYGDLRRRENVLALAEDMLATPTIARWPIDLDARALVERAGESSFKGLYEALHVAYADLSGKPRWGEKTPRNSFWMAEIKRDFPDAQFVHILRDGRDMAIDIADSPQMRPFSVFTGVQVWRNCVEAIRDGARDLDPADYHEIRYEALCAAPRPELEKLCDFLGLDFDPAMLEHHRAESAQSWSSDPQHAKSGRPITTEFCEMWKHRLPPDDVLLLEGEIGDLLEATGYARSGRPRKLDPVEARKLLQSDVVTAPPNYAYKAWHEERRKERLARGIYSPSDRTSLLWSLT